MVVDAAYFGDATTTVTSGTFLSGERPGIVLSMDNARLLGVSVGDEMGLFVESARGVPLRRNLPVTGLFESGHAGIDGTAFFVRHEEAQSLDDPQRAAAFVDLHREVFDRLGVEASTWREIHGSMIVFVEISGLLTAVINAFVMIVSVAWVRGYFTSLFGGIIRIDTGRAQVLHEEYRSQERMLPPDLTVNGYESVRDRLLELPSVMAVSARLDFGAQIAHVERSDRSTRLLGRGIEPEYEEQITVIWDHIVDGYPLSLERPGLLLGKELASRLRARPGDRLSLGTFNRDSRWQEETVDLVGVFSLGYPAIDETTFLVSMPIAQRITGVGDAVTRLVIALDAGPAVGSHVGRLNEALSRDQAELQAYPWRSFVEVIVQAVEADTAGFAIIIAVLYLLIVMGILNSMSMSVQERRRAIGMKRPALRRLILVEGAAVALMTT